MLNERNLGYNEVTAEIYLQNFSDNPSRSLVGAELENFLSLFDGRERVLDIGCGNAQEAALTQRFFLRYVGLDISEPMLRRVENHDSMDLVVGDLSSLPFDDNSFDAIISLWAFQYTGNLNETIFEASRVLVNKGSFFVAVPHPIYKLIKYSHNYFVTGPQTEEGLGIQRVNYYYTLSDYLNAFYDNSLNIGKVVEPRREGESKEYSGFSKQNIPHDLILVGYKS